MSKRQRRLADEELQTLDERVARGETTFDEETLAIVAHGCRAEVAALEAALERALCRGEDPPPTQDDIDEIPGTV